MCGPSPPTPWIRSSITCRRRILTPGGCRVHRVKRHRTIGGEVLAEHSEVVIVPERIGQLADLLAVGRHDRRPGRLERWTKVGTSAPATHVQAHP